MRAIVHRLGISRDRHAEQPRQVSDGSTMTSTTADHVTERVLATLYDYLDRVDANDAEGAAAHFADDGWADYMTGRRLDGPAHIARALATLLANFSVTSHHVTNPRVQVEDGRGRLRAYVYAYHRLVETGRPWHFWGRYEAQLEWRGQTWKFTELTLIGVDSEPEWHLAPASSFAGHPGRNRVD